VLGTVSLIAGLLDRRGNLAHKVARLWAWLIVKTTGVRIRRTGQALPPETDSAVFVANHASFFDIPIVFNALPRQLRLMAKASLLYVPFIGWHLHRSGHVLVDRTKPGAAIFKRMRRMARSGASLLVFPEGGRNDGELRKFKAGIFLLAIEHHLPIVPVTILGNRDDAEGAAGGDAGRCPGIIHDGSTESLTRRRAAAARVEGIIRSFRLFRARRDRSARCRFHRAAGLADSVRSRPRSRSMARRPARRSRGRATFRTRERRRHHRGAHDGKRVGLDPTKTRLSSEALREGAQATRCRASTASWTSSTGARDAGAVRA
jgi:1-acyl-sn-glycerol-3-phosphate acyltransferase